MLTFAFCTYNRASRLPALVATMRRQQSPVPFEILAINNNSADGTAEVLAELARQPGVPLRWVTESQQGIVAARNRGIAEALASDVLIFIDDDELPLPGLVAGAADAILNEGAQCAGGRVDVDFSTTLRPRWLEDELLGFLAALDHGPQPFWIHDLDTPIWTSNVAYDMRLFRDDPGLRFDKRYTRVGKDVGGGEDAAMLSELLRRGARIRYRPDMAVLHAVEGWRLQRRYFLRLHYRAGQRVGRFELPEYPRKILGVPPFLVRQLLGQVGRTLRLAITARAGLLRQAMNCSHAFGMLVGYSQR